MHAVAKRTTEVRTRLGCSEAGKQKKSQQKKSVTLYEVERITPTHLEIFLDVCKEKYMRALIEPGKCRLKLLQRSIRPLLGRF